MSAVTTVFLNAIERIIILKCYYLNIRSVDIIVNDNDNPDFLLDIYIDNIIR